MLLLLLLHQCPLVDRLMSWMLGILGSAFSFCLFQERQSRGGER